MLRRLMGSAQATRGLSRGLDKKVVLCQISTSTVASAGPSRRINVDSSASPSFSPFPQSPQPVSTLTWDRYLRLRKQRWIVGLISSGTTTTLAALTSSLYLLMQDIDFTNTIMGFDAVYVNVAGIFACTGLGFLVGPSIGESLWSTYRRKLKNEIEIKDKIFYQHIIAKRGDPSRQTLQKGPPDFYGEKIGSIAEYRDWLRSQAAYQRRVAHGVDDDLKAL